MSLPQPVTEIIILHVKEAVDLDSAGGSPAVQGFVQLTNTLKAQQGFKCQFWGHQVEHPNIFVWFIDWESFQRCTEFINSEEHKSFVAGFSQAFDLKVAQSITMYTYWTSDAGAAFKAPVTEFAFFTLPNGASEEAKTVVEDALEPILQAVKTVGKASCSAIGWAFEITPPGTMLPQPGGEWLQGVFGYDSIDDHMKWRETPEHDKAGEVFEDLDRRNVSLRPASVSGIDPSTDYFHVRFAVHDKAETSLSVFGHQGSWSKRTKHIRLRNRDPKGVALQ